MYYISLVGVDQYGFVEEDEYIFDIYTKLYDFVGTNVNVLSAQDLWEFYKQHNNQEDSGDILNIDLSKLGDSAERDHNDNKKLNVDGHIKGHFKQLWMRFKQPFTKKRDVNISSPGDSHSSIVESVEKCRKYVESERKKVSVYALVELFIKNHPNGHFIIDECPIPRESGKCYTDCLN